MNDLERGKLKEKIRELERTGFPEKAQKLRGYFNRDVFPLEDEIEKLNLPESEINLNDKLAAMPARAGKGSSLKDWKAFARQYSDIEPDVIDAVYKRDEMIALLEANGVIPKAE